MVSSWVNVNVDVFSIS
jgi:transposase